MSDGSLLYLSREDVISVGLSMAQIIDALEVAFREKGEGRTEMPPKPGVHPGGGDNFLHAMPAYIPRLGSAGVKWVGGSPTNRERGLPYISGLLIFNDVQTMLPLAVMDCTWITAMRTGAATAVAARRLARAESSAVGILGCGVQGRTNLEALNVLFPLERVVAYDVDTDAAERYADEIETRFGLTVAMVVSPQEAVTGCDIVVTAGPLLKEPHRTIQPGWLDKGAFASLVDYDSYFHPDALREASKFCTDDTAQLRAAQAGGYFRDIPRIHADLGELAAGTRPGRESPEEITITAKLGLAIDDMAVAPLIYQMAKQKGIGAELPL